MEQKKKRTARFLWWIVAVCTVLLLGLCVWVVSIVPEEEPAALTGSPSFSASIEGGRCETWGRVALCNHTGHPVTITRIQPLCHGGHWPDEVVAELQSGIGGTFATTLIPTPLPYVMEEERAELCLSTIQRLGDITEEEAENKSYGVVGVRIHLSDGTYYDLVAGN